MTADRLASRLAAPTIACVLLALVVGALTAASTPAATAPLTVVTAPRAMPLARHLLRDAEAPTPRTVAVSLIQDGDPGMLDGTLVIYEPPASMAAAPEPEPAVEEGPAAPRVTDATVRAELAMLDLMNASRTAAGLLPLALDARVSATARAHSEVESAHGYVYHDGADGTARSRDATACATGWYGENTGKVWDENVLRLHREFMAEPWEPINHRTNIMDPLFRRVGVGAVIGRDAMYLTMVFCR